MEISTMMDRLQMVGLTSNNVDTNHTTIECFEILELENDLEESRPNSFTECKKNPGHEGFSPVADFTLTRLPDDYQDQDLIDCIQTLADLTVLVSTRRIGEARRKHYQDGNRLYPQGDKVLSWRHGSGWLGNVVKFARKRNKVNKSCPCRKCKGSPTPSTEWGEVELYASTHVVFDDDEASDTVVRLFYDDVSSDDVTLEGWRMWWSNVAEDTCKMICQTCDVALLDKLAPIVERHNNLRYKIFNKYKKCEERLAIIVSHPHGCPKMASVGKWTLRKEVKPDRHNMETYYEYTTSTCPGSSGGPVLILGGCPGKMPFGHRHSGVNANKKNFSATAWD